jgi:superfamily I DNA and/or RNA helicase
MLLGDGEDERRCRALLELQEDWMLRVGRSSDFHAAMLASAHVVAGTCIGMAGVRGMSDVAYDLCIVDEASKATATEILVPMSRSRKWILVGDPEQLPPFFEDDSITQIGDFDEMEVRETLLDRFLGGLPKHSIARLTNQHRMVRAIGDLISEAFYDRALVSPKTKPNVTLPGAFPKPVTWLSTTDVQDAREVRRGASFRNDGECRIIRDALEQINFLARKRKAVYDIAIIAGYVAQVKALQDIIRDRLHEWSGLKITCSTVDAFQGSEAEICIYSVTRSNPAGKLGFLREKPRLNVALSRGRSALIIVGDDSFCRSATGENPFHKVLDFIQANPEHCERRSVQ